LKELSHPSSTGRDPGLDPPQGRVGAIGRDEVFVPAALDHGAALDDTGTRCAPSCVRVSKPP